MNRFTIYCTEEQTKRAYKLGAPLEIGFGKGTICCQKLDTEGYTQRKIPTTEQMIGWLEEQIDEIEVIHICDDYGNGWCYTIFDKGWCNVGFNRNFNSRKEAILAAIDAALDYLEKGE